jgi:hypothetical protein
METCDKRHPDYSELGKKGYGIVCKKLAMHDKEPHHGWNAAGVEDSWED